MEYPFIRRPLPPWIMPVVEAVYRKMSRDATGHDFLHAVRVMEGAHDIAASVGADGESAMAAGLLHDYYRSEEKETGMLHYGAEAVGLLRNEFERHLLPALGGDRFEVVLDAIARHEEYDFSPAEPGQASLSLVARSLQDADRLEAIGAVGIARTFMFGGAHGLPLYSDQEQLDELFDPAQKPRHSVYRHFYEKLLRLADRMHTERGKQLAARRNRYMRSFLSELEEELGIAKTPSP